VLRNAGVLPEGAALLKEINETAARLDAGRDPQERERLRREIAELKLKYDLHRERHRGR
jgi:hypothetical protein